MTSSAYELDGQMYVWTGSRWYRKRDFVTPPGTVIHRLDKLRGDEPAEDGNSAAEGGGLAVDAEELIEQARQIVWEREDPYSVKRPLMKCRASELRGLFEERHDDPDGLREILVELLFRHVPGALALRGEVAERLVDLSRDAFLWPTTDVLMGDGSLDGDDWPQEGILAHLGYHVGQSGARAESRHGILDLAYRGRLPNVNDAGYMASWGEPGTAKRLKRIAESLAAFCRNFRRRGSSSVAVAQWEDDLAYLKKQCYDGCYSFVWPET